MYNLQMSPRTAVFALAVFFLSTLVFSGATQAKITIALDDDYAFSFSGGQIDTNRYDGEIFDVEFLKNGRILATADRLLVESEGEFDTPDFIVKQLAIDNLALDSLALNSLVFAGIAFDNSDFTDGKITVEVGALRASNFLLAALRWDELAFQEQWPGQWPINNSPAFLLEDIQITDGIKGLSISIEQFSSEPARFATLADGTAYLAEARAELTSMRIMPIGRGEDAVRFRNSLEMMGVEYFEVSVTSKLGMRPLGTGLAFNICFNSRMTGLLDIIVDSELYISHDTYKALGEATLKFIQHNRNLGNYYDEQSVALMTEYFAPLIDDIQLGALQIAFTDKGLLAQIDRFDRGIPPRAILAMAAEATIRSYLPQNGGNLVPFVKKLLMEGGTLQITAEPKMPFPLRNLVGAHLAPDRVASQLHLSATHQP